MPQNMTQLKLKNPELSYFGTDYDGKIDNLNNETTPGVSVSEADVACYITTSNFQILWEIEKLKSILHTVPDDQNLHMKIEIDLAKVTFLPKAFSIFSRSDDASALNKICVIYEHSGSTHTFPSIIEFSLTGGLIDKSLFLGALFEKSDNEFKFPFPEISFSDIDRLKVLEAQIRGSSLYVTGWVINESFPGIPTRVQLLTNGELQSECLAHLPGTSVDESAPSSSYAFKMCCAITRDYVIDDAMVRIKNGNTYNILTTVTQSIQISEKTQNIHFELDKNCDVIGKIEKIGARTIEGWALARAKPDFPVTLLLYVEDVAILCSQTSINRKDVQARHGGTGFNGFIFTIPVNLQGLRGNKWSIRPFGGRSLIESSEFSMPNAGHRLDGELPDYHLRVSHEPLRIEPITIIVINHNKKDQLKILFDSASKHEPWEYIEWIIVDRGSSDDSESVYIYARNKGQRVKFIEAKGDLSLGSLYNIGRRYASHGILLFIDNHMEFDKPFVSRIVSELSRTDVGIVGASATFYLGDESGSGISLCKYSSRFIEPLLVDGRFVSSDGVQYQEDGIDGSDMISVPAVSANFFGIKTADLDAVGGWEEGYQRSLMDVDLCMKVKSQLGKSSILINSIDFRYEDRDLSSQNILVAERDIEQFNTKWGKFLRRRIKSDVVNASGYWSGQNTTIGFVVVDYGDSTQSGEYFTALELAREIKNITNFNIVFLKESEWYDLQEIDILIVMVNRFDLSKIKKVRPSIITINWMRQWFDRWSEDDSIFMYDYLFASSDIAKTYLQKRIARDVELLRIATNSNAMKNGVYTTKYGSDFSINANKVGTNREIELCLGPNNIAGNGALFGSGWQGSALESICRGSVAYSDMPNLYASTKVIIDDANVATKDWGSVNSRVFDAIAAGKLVLTNGRSGVAEIFGDLVPTFDSRDSLTELLNYWLNNHEEREARSRILQSIVCNEHDYRVRADSLITRIKCGPMPIRISIKCDALLEDRVISEQFQCAQNLASALRQLNFVVRVDCFEEWYSPISDADDVALVISGNRVYRPKINQLNLLWIIYDPHAVSINNMRSYDRVFSASRVHSEIISSLSGIEVDVMLPWTDCVFFNIPQDVHTFGQSPPVIARSMAIDLPRFANLRLQSELDIDPNTYSSDMLIDKLYEDSLIIDSSCIGVVFRDARFVYCINDIDRARLGYIPNDAFNVLACGGNLVLDTAHSTFDEIPSSYFISCDRGNTSMLFSHVWDTSLSERKARSSWVHEHHSVHARARHLSACIDEYFCISPLSSD